MKSLFEFLSAISALTAAVLWFLSAKVQIPNRLPIVVTSRHTMADQVIGANVISTGSSNELDDVARALIKQSSLSAWAAAFAAAAATFQFAAWCVS